MKAFHPDTRPLCGLAMAAGFALLTSTAVAHNRVDSPNGGEVLHAGSTVTIEWHVAIPHQLIDWSISYSVMGVNGPYIPIASGVPAGDPNPDVPHYFDWVVPDTPSSQVRVRVDMNNVNIDYFDESDADLTIAPAAATGYCSGKQNSLGCVPFLSYEGAPSTTSTLPFRLTARDVLPGESGFLLYSLSKASLPFHNATLCVKAPFTRQLPLKTSTNTGAAPCSGRFVVNFNNRIQAGVDPRLSVGATLNAQWYYRDPGVDTFNDGLTNGMRFTIQP